MEVGLSLHSGASALRLPSAAEMAAFDNNTINRGVSAGELMERAGSAMAERIYQQVKTRNILIFCGPGNNGGDGFVVAKLLSQQGLRVSCVLLATKELSKECQSQFQAYLKIANVVYGLKDSLEIPGLNIISYSELDTLLNQNEIFVDAIFGTGQKNDLPHQIELVLAKICLHANKFKIALDVPTGIDPSSGAVSKATFKADLTLCVQNIKRGMLQYPARKFCGEIQTLDIAIDSSAGCEFELLTRSNIECLNVRELDAHKGNFGRVLVIGGSRTMPGAPILAATAALRAGAGIVRLASCAKDRLVPPEIMLVDLAEAVELKMLHFEKLAAAIKQTDVLLIGPGLGLAKATAELLQQIFTLTSKQNIPCVVDADALNLWAEEDANFQVASFVATPHPGEMARLLKCSVNDVQTDRYVAIKRAYEIWGGVWLLKGASSICYSNSQGFVNPLGNPYMATAGSGDVLAGIIAAFLAQGLSVFEACKLGSYAHALAGDLASSEQKFIIASDIIRFLPKALSGFYAS